MAATLHVVIVGSPNVNPGYKLVNNKTYPQIAADYRHGSKCSRIFPATSSSAPTASTSTCAEKYARCKAGDKNAFIDPAGYKAYIADREQAFEAELQKQR